MITPEDQNYLLAIARRALEARVRGGRPPAVECTGTLALRRGAFVSIHRRGNLRGCLGRLTLETPLGQTIVHLAGVVADSDPRFAAVLPHELPDLQIEISVLTPEREITSVDEIEVGRHGLIVEDGTLPRVAAAAGRVGARLDRETFLEHTCIKAGLPRDAWKKGARIFVFEAQVFGEDQSGGTTAI